MIIPRPVTAHAHPGGGRVTLAKDGFVIAADEASRPAAALLRAALEASTGWDIAVVPAADEVRPNAVTLTVGRPDGALQGGPPGDGYWLRAAPGEGVVINGGGPAGVFYGTQSLRLLLPPDTLRQAPVHGVPAALELPAVTIEDVPRYTWRGVHLDVARHFFPKAWILRLIDLAALRDAMRLDGTITPARLLPATQEAVASTVASLATWAEARQAEGSATLADVPALAVDDESIDVQRFRRAVYCHAKANLLERYSDYETTGRERRKDQDDARAEQAEQHRRDATWAIRDILGVTRLAVELI